MIFFERNDGYPFAAECFVAKFPPIKIFVNMHDGEPSPQVENVIFRGCEVDCRCCKLYHDEVLSQLVMLHKKFTAENLLTKVCIENNIKLIKVRPPLIYGKDDLSRGYGPTGFTYKAMDNEEIVLWGDGSEYREFVYIDDVCLSVRECVVSDTVEIRQPSVMNYSN